MRQRSTRIRMVGRVGRRKVTAYDPKHTTSSMKHRGGSMAANATGSLVFIEGVTADKSSRLNSEVFLAIISAHSQLRQL